MINKKRFASKNGLPLVEEVILVESNDQDDERVRDGLIVKSVYNSLSSEYINKIHKDGKTIQPNDKYWDYFNLPLDTGVDIISEKEYIKLKKSNDDKIKKELEDVFNSYNELAKNNFKQLVSDGIPEASARIITNYKG